MIISAIDIWFIETILTMKIVLKMVLTILVFFVLMDLFSAGKLYTEICLRVDYFKRSSVLVAIAICGTLLFAFPSTVSLEHWIVDKYATPSIIEKFQSEDDFYNQLGYELSTISIMKNSVVLPLKRDGGK